MTARTRIAFVAVLALAVCAGAAQADLTSSLKQGAPDLKSIGPVAFGSDGVIFVGDPAGAAIFAIDTGDRTPAPAGPFQIDGVGDKIASLLGTAMDQIQINDMAVNPASGNAYLSVTRGKAAEAKPVLVRATNKGKIEEVSLQSVKFAKAELPNAPQDRGRAESITDLAFVKGQVIVAGLSSEEFASTLRAIPFPFAESGKGAGIRIFHGAHGRYETNAPVRTFVPFDIKGEAHILAAYTCTPLVKIPVSELKPGAKVNGTTVAELGNRNRPLDMIVYQKDGKNYLLLNNSARGVMKITTEEIDSVKAITNPVGGGGTAGLKYDTIQDLKGVVQLDKLDKEHALLLVQGDGGMSLRSIALP